MATAAHPSLALSTTRLSAGLAILRAITGVIFVAHGAQKLFQFGIAGVTEGFAGMGIPFPSLAAPFVAGVEFFGGLALLVGLFTPIAAGLLAMVMLGAMVTVHLPNGFFAPNGIEFVLALFASALMFAITGAGEWSVDGWRKNRR